MRIYDLGSSSGFCGMCGYQVIRYVHEMSHPAFSHRVGAGCICAGKMEGDQERAINREREYKNMLQRRKNFLRKKWTRRTSGNMYIKYRNNNITLLQDKNKQGEWKYVLNGYPSDFFPSQEAAMLGAFDAIVVSESHKYSVKTK